ncbi:nicotinamide N-methyltransferase-like [Dendropsophus ebraccatus]|uniref:nicotinamide N-methyltransferase-like n=1 Tax=Dendropsophus ebraccatus TaxID=150705 RepID=UPI0038317EE5
MASSTHKLYHVHGCDSRQLLEDYFSDKAEMVFAEDSLIFPIEQLTRTFAGGHIKGDILVDLSAGSPVHHLYVACEFFEHIIVLKASDRCIMEMKKWLDTRTGAFSWEHAAKILGEIEGKRDELDDKKAKVRSAAQHVVICDFEKKNVTDPIVLPPADCIISGLLLDFICKDQDDYIRYLRKFSGLLKPGGHLILFGALDRTYAMVGKDKIHSLTYDEEFVKKALVGEGFVIDDCKVKERTAVSHHTDYKAVIFIAAHMEK